MWIRKYAMPIFLLYIITSSIFLLVFSFIYFQSSKNHLIQEIVLSLSEQMVEIKSQLNGSESVSREAFANLNDEVKINLFDMKSQQYIIEEFVEPLGGKSIRKKVQFGRKHKSTMEFNNIIFSDKKVYLFDFLGHKEQHDKMGHQRGNLKGYKLVLEHSGYSSLVQIVIIKIITVAIFVFLCFILISYFIIRLSFRPLVEKINSLNSFIADATHEINTPLSVILMSVEMFDNNPNKYLSNIKTASKTLSSLYNDLVNLNLKSEPNLIEKINIKNKILERILYFSALAQEKNLTVKQNLLELFLETDIAKFEKIFDNIFSNAIKYSDENSEISVTLTKKSLSIKNVGQTIQSQNLSKIYDKFSRFDKRKGGFGIGLSIVKKYCNELGFKIECKSSEQITEFIINFD